MLEFRNTPRENGVSQAEMVFGHQLRSIIPAYRTSYAARWKAVMEGSDRQAEIDALVKFRYDEHARPLSPLPFGTHVRIWNPKSKLWESLSASGAIAPTASNSQVSYGETTISYAQ